MDIKDFEPTAEFFFGVGIALIVSSIAKMSIDWDILFYAGIIVLIFGVIIKSIIFNKTK